MDNLIVDDALLVFALNPNRRVVIRQQPCFRTLHSLVDNTTAGLVYPALWMAAAGMRLAEDVVQPMNLDAAQEPQLIGPLLQPPTMTRDFLEAITGAAITTYVFCQESQAAPGVIDWEATDVCLKGLSEIIKPSQREAAGLLVATQIDRRAILEAYRLYRTSGGGESFVKFALGATYNMTDGLVVVTPTTDVPQYFEEA